jgi:hypothetical protein
MEFTLMPLADVYQLIDKQMYGQQPVENVWFFERLDAGGSAADLIDAFVSGIFPQIRAIQGNGIYHAEITCQSLGDLSDFDTQVTNVYGTYGAVDVLPSFNAVGFTLKPATRAVRPGSKRFVGVPEEAVISGTIVFPAYLTALEALRIELDDNQVGTDSEYQPVIVKRVRYQPDPVEEPDKWSYRLPETDAELVLGLVKQALLNPETTSQVSRKI